MTIPPAIKAFLAAIVILFGPLVAAECAVQLVTLIYTGKFAPFRLPTF